LYPRHIIEHVLNSTDIVQIVSTYCDLKPSGPDRYKALCPFHTEKTPSFMVSHSRQIYHCFGCGKGGDAISFLMEMQNISFMEALEILADRAGVMLPRLNSGMDGKAYNAIKEERKTLFQILELSADFYRSQLTKTLTGKLALDYLERRKLSPQIQEEFKIGFAPADGYTLYRYLKSKGFSDKLLQKTGLIRSFEQEGRYYDFFRNRILFPIRSIEGKIIAFGGREISGDGPKYINIAETEIYRKSKVLYGLWEGKESIRSQQFAIFVEGYIDLLRCFQNGIKNVVATCGTALTLEQANLIKRFAPRVVIVYDGDEAGLSAALRATSILLQAGLNVHAVTLPDGKDPDDFLQEHSVSEWNELIHNAPTFFTFYLQQKKALLSTPTGKVTVLSELFRLISTMKENTLKEEYLKEIASALHINFWSIQSDYEQYLNNNFSTQERISVPNKFLVPMDDLDFIYAILHNDGLREKVKDCFYEIPFPENSFGFAIKYILENENPDPRFIEDKNAGKILQGAYLIEPKSKNLDILVEERLKRFRIDYLNKQIEEIQEKIRLAEKSQQSELLIELIKAQNELINRRNTLT